MDDVDSPHTAHPLRADRLVLRVRSVADLLALVPVTLGFEPDESLVVVGVGGRHPGFQVRVDLPRRAAVTTVAEQVTAAVRVQGCTRVAVVVFSRRRTTAERAARATAAAVVAEGLELLDVLRTDGDRYWSLTCTDERCCPSTGTPYDPLATTVRAQATLAGRVVAPDRGSLARRYAPVAGAARGPAREAQRRAEDEAVAVLGLRGPDQLRRPTGRLVERAAPVGVPRVDATLERLLTVGDAHAIASAVTDAHAATLAVWCSMVPLRDLAWSRMTREDAADHLALWTAVAQRVVPPYEPAVLGLAAFAAWLSGDGASAWCLLDRCAAVDPAYSMADRLRDALERCIGPDVWSPVPRELVLRACGITG